MGNKMNTPIIMEVNLPSSLGVDILSVSTSNLVGNNLDVLGLVSEELHQESVDDRDHPGRQHHNRHVVVLGPVVKFGEVWIKCDSLAEELDTFAKGSVDTVKHLPEAIPNCQESANRPNGLHH